MDLTKEAINHLMNQLIDPSDREVLVNGNHVIIDDEGKPMKIDPAVYKAKSTIAVNTLTSLVSYIKNNKDRPGESFYVHVKDEQTVYLLGLLEKDGSREILIGAHTYPPEFDYGRFYDMERFNVSLQSKFVDLSNETEYDDRALLLQIAGNVTEENVRTTGDDGISQAVTMKSGIANQSDVKIPNPVTLAPYRTFLEVEQPASQFIFRMQDGPKAAIFEADGGAWRNQAIVNIREYLKEELANEIENGKIILLA